MTKKNEITPEELAHNGDFKGLLQLIRERPYAFQHERKVNLLRIALTAAATKDFDEYVRLIYEHMIVFTGDLLVISQATAEKRVDHLAKEVAHSHDSCVVYALNSVFPKVEKLHHHLILLTKAYGTTSHTQKLGRLEKSAPTDRAAVLKLVRDTEALTDTKEATHG